MRIVFLNPSGQLGGAERSLLDILASLRAAEPAWTLDLVVTADGPLVPRAEALGVRVHVVEMPAGISRLGDGGAGAAGAGTLFGRIARAAPDAVGYLRRLRGLLRRLAPDVIHSNGFKMHVLGLWSRPRGVPVVWHVHDFVGRRPVMSRLLRLHAGRCAAAIANSRSVAADLGAVCGGKVPVHAVYNAVDLGTFSPEGERLDLDARAGLAPAPPGTVRVGLVATLGWWKGHQTFLRAVSRLAPDLPVRAYVVGGALYETENSQHSLQGLRALARELGIEERVGFTGFVEDAAAAMRALDVVVHASTEPEPFGLVVVEAMACGRALIASQAGGAAELFVPGREALGHPPGDDEVLAERIATLVSDADLRARLGAAGRRAVEASFDRTRLATELAPIYRAVAGGRG